MTIDAQFRVYHNDAESIADHAELLATSGYYTRAMADRAVPDAFANDLTGVYATDPDYGANLIALMKLYNLYQYDTARADGHARHPHGHAHGDHPAAATGGHPVDAQRRRRDHAGARRPPARHPGSVASAPVAGATGRRGAGAAAGDRERPPAPGSPGRLPGLVTPGRSRPRPRTVTRPGALPHGAAAAAVDARRLPDRYGGCHLALHGARPPGR